MKFLQLFTVSQPFLIVLAKLNDSSRDNNRIIGGNEVPARRFSYTVSLADSFGSFCGGSVIAPDVILTAAHCQGGNYNIIVGRHDLSDEKSGESIPIDYEMPHPEYDDTTTNNDFNLVFLSRSISEEHLKMVRLNARDDFPAVGDSLHVMGWGDTAPEDDIQTVSDVLMGVEVKMISNNDCRASKGSIYGYEDSYQGQITDRMMCARDDNQDSCQGDSGGPLVVKEGANSDIQVGVVSWGVGCAHESFPGVYARISSAYDWIKQQVCAKSSDPPSSFNCGSNFALEQGSTTDTLSAAGNFVSSLHQKSSLRDSQAQQWNVIAEDDFSGSGFFKTGSIGSTLYRSAKGRTGVVKLQRTSIASKPISNVLFDKIQVLLSFQLVDANKDSGICLDYSEDEGASWTEFACHRSSSAFTKDVWYDDISAELRPSELVQSLMIRLRQSESQCDTLIDKVVIKGLKQ